LYLYIKYFNCVNLFVISIQPFFYCSLLYRVCRCVQDDQRSFALGIQWIKVRLIGTIPAPMVFGALIDETCILWQESCNEENGACLVYDNQYMGR
jgi:hypothetical protein